MGTFFIILGVIKLSENKNLCDFSKRLKKLRKEKGLSQDALAKLCNLNRVAICQYENGKSSPKIPTLLILAELFNTSVDYLCGATSIKQKYNTRRCDIRLNNIGLNDNSLDMLNKLQSSDSQSDKNALKAINILLDTNRSYENFKFFNNIYLFLYHCIKSNNKVFDYWQLNNNQNLPADKELNIIITPDELEYALLLNNNSYLKKLKEELKYSSDEED